MDTTGAIKLSAVLGITVLAGQEFSRVKIAKSIAPTQTEMQKFYNNPFPLMWQILYKSIAVCQ